MENTNQPHATPVPPFLSVTTPPSILTRPKKEVKKDVPGSPYITILEKLGLNKNEAQIYELLLNTGPQSMKPILFHTKLKRGNAYYHLDSLVARDLVEKLDLPGQTAKFSAKHPEQLELILAKQKAALAAAQEELNQTLPELKSLFQLISSKPGVKFFEGREGIIKIYEEILATKADVDSIEDKGEMVAYIPDYVPVYVKKRVQNKMRNRVISPNVNRLNLTSKENLRESRLLPVADFPFRMDIKIAGFLVSLITFQKENAVGILIENREIAENFRFLFNLLWKLLEPKTGLRPDAK